MNEDIFEEIVRDIGARKNLAGLSDDVVRNAVQKVLVSTKKVREKVDAATSFDQLSRSSLYKELKSHARDILHKAYGVFQADSFENRERLVSELVQEKSITTPNAHQLINQLLLTHVSTRDRALFYDELYSELSPIVENKRILDLGAGMNPFSIPKMPVKIKEYVAVELSGRECALVQHFLDWAGMHLGFTGKTIALDLSKKESTNKIPEADVAFMFALLEVLEGSHHRLAETIMTGVKAKKLVVSFPRITVGGKRMVAQRRGWFEKMCERLGYSFKKISFPNETFYVVEKEASS